MSPPVDPPRPAGTGLVAETERLRLRRLTVGDARFVLQLVGEPAFIANIGDKQIRDEASAARFIREGAWTNQPRPGHGQFVMESRESGEPLGVCGLLYRESLELTDIGFAVLAGHRGLGLALEASRALMRYGHETLGIERLFGIVARHNEPSIRILLRLGMERLRELDAANGEVPLLLYGEPGPARGLTPS